MTASTTERPLGFGLELPFPHEQAIEQVTAALKEQGFGVLTTIDVKATFKEKLGQEFRPYTILGACNPPLAYRALSADLEVGLMLPCNVVVYERDSTTSWVEFLDPLAALGVVGKAQLAPIAREATARLERAAATLAGR
ncbi:MAG TPA: DUF302 domain-containing protein [Chloroflexota bacterium]|nr:DUF302 domain-containing protein [Chloroflexota bacterium]